MVTSFKSGNPSSHSKKRTAARFSYDEESYFCKLLSDLTRII